MPYLSNREIKTAPDGYVPASETSEGVCLPPQCCGGYMADDGGCSEGCCDDYKCLTCGYRVRIEWPD